jgi:hypothetical protein
MVQSGLDISPIITHRFDFRDFEKGFEAMISGEAGKVILDWTTADAEAERKVETKSAEEAVLDIQMPDAD